MRVENEFNLAIALRSSLQKEFLSSHSEGFILVLHCSLSFQKFTSWLAVLITTFIESPVHMSVSPGFTSVTKWEINQIKKT